MKIEKDCVLGYLSPIGTVVWNLGMAYIVYFIARLVFLVTNYSFYEGHLAFPHLMEMLGGGLVFDTAAILVTNSLYIVILLLTPWRRLAQWVYVVINAVALAVNLADCVYFRFTMRRTTTTVFNEFQNENNLAGVIGTELVNHWYLVLLFIILVYAMWKLYRSPGKAVPVGKWWVWYPSQVLLLAACAPFVVAEAVSPRLSDPSPSRMPTSMWTVPSKRPWCSTPPSRSTAPLARMSSWCPIILVTKKHWRLYILPSILLTTVWREQILHSTLFTLHLKRM